MEKFSVTGMLGINPTDDLTEVYMAVSGLNLKETKTLARELKEAGHITVAYSKVRASDTALLQELHRCIAVGICKLIGQVDASGYTIEEGPFDAFGDDRSFSTFQPSTTSLQTVKVPELYTHALVEFLTEEERANVEAIVGYKIRPYLVTGHIFKDNQAFELPGVLDEDKTHERGFLDTTVEDLALEYELMDLELFEELDYHDKETMLQAHNEYIGSDYVEYMNPSAEVVKYDEVTGVFVEEAQCLSSVDRAFYIDLGLKIEEARAAQIANDSCGPVLNYWDAEHKCTIRSPWHNRIRQTSGSEPKKIINALNKAIGVEPGKGLYQQRLAKVKKLRKEATATKRDLYQQIEVLNKRLSKGETVIKQIVASGKQLDTSTAAGRKARKVLLSKWQEATDLRDLLQAKRTRLYKDIDKIDLQLEVQANALGLSTNTQAYYDRLDVLKATAGLPEVLWNKWANRPNVIKTWASKKPSEILAIKACLKDYCDRRSK